MGSGAGFPGSGISIIAAKDRKIPIKVKLIEKSPKKAKFLKKLIMNFNIKALEVINENIFEDQKKLSGDVFLARAFKPLAKLFRTYSQ